MKEVVLVSVITLIIFISGCVTETHDVKTQAVDACVRECESVKRSIARGLSNGPCLSNKIIEDWVCDVAHDPRQAVDNDPKNQCQEFGKTAKHFVEVDQTCKLIRAV